MICHLKNVPESENIFFFKLFASCIFFSKSTALYLKMHTAP